MTIVKSENSKRVVVVVLLMSLILAMIPIQGVFAAGTTITPVVPVEKQLKQTVPGSGGYGTFDFLIEGESHPEGVANIAGMPMPTEAPDGEFSIDITEDSTDLTEVKSLNFDFTNAPVGVYEYKISEVVPAETGNIEYAINAYKVIVTVHYNETGELTATTVIYDYDSYDANSLEAGKIEKALFVNNYKTSFDRTLLVDNKVTGNLGDKDKDFAYKLNIDKYTPTNEETEKTEYNATITRKDESTEDIPITSGVDYEFNLKDIEKIEVKGLPEALGYKVTQNDYTADGYTTTHIFTDGSGSSVDPISELFHAGTFGETNTVNYTNDKSSDVPTGIYMDVIIFGGIMLIGIAGALVFMRKRQVD